MRQKEWTKRVRVHVQYVAFLRLRYVIIIVIIIIIIYIYIGILYNLPHGRQIENCLQAFPCAEKSTFQLSRTISEWNNLVSWVCAVWVAMPMCVHVCVRAGMCVPFLKYHIRCKYAQEDLGKAIMQNDNRFI